MLKLTKKGDKYWLFEDTEIGLFSPSKFTINLELNQIVIVYENGLKSKKYNVSDCEIYDLEELTPFTTSSGDLFMQKLEELNCPCFQKNENIFNISGGSWGNITGTLSDQTDLQTALNAKQNSLGFTPEDVSNKENTALDTSTTKYPTNRLVKEVTDVKLDKDNTPLSVYAVDGSGNQEMKLLSDFVTGKEYTFNTNVSQSFGDSITVGQNSTGDNSYIKLLCALYGTTNTNRAVAGRGIWEACRLHNANVNPTTNAFSVVMAGFNDVRRGGNDAKTLSKIENGYKGIIVNQFMRTSLAGGAVSASITKVGSWSTFFADTVGGKYNNGTFSSTSGNYIEYAFSDNNVTLGMIGGDGVSQIYGNFDVHIDGILQGSYSVNNKTDGISDGSNNNQRAPYILFFTGLADGNHTIRVTLTNSLPVPVDYFGHLKDSNLCTPILLMEAPKMNSTGYAIAPANATDAIINQLNALINSVAGLFSSKYPIIIGKTNDYYNITTGLDTDNIHPNNLGHRQIYQAGYEALREVILVQVPTSTNLLLSNNSWTGTNDYTQRVKTSSGFQTQGALTSPTGVGVEIEYNLSEGYVTSYNRSSSSWVNLNIRGAILKFLSGGTQRMEVNTSGLKLNTLPTYADDTTAVAGGLTSGQLYKTATGEVRVKL